MMGGKSLLLLVAAVSTSAGAATQGVIHVRSYEPMPGATDKKACEHWRETASFRPGLKVDCQARTVTETRNKLKDGESVEQRQAQFKGIVCNPERGYLSLLQRGWRFIEIYQSQDGPLTFEPRCD
jgi:hypothetical protein